MLEYEPGGDYQWKDENGVVHYEDNLPKDARSVEHQEDIDSNSIIKNGINKYRASRGLPK